MRFETQILGLDRKRVHVFHRMVHGRTRELVSVNDLMLLHVDSKKGKAAAMPDEVFAPLEAIWKVHRKLKKPKDAGRKIGMKH
jgi:carnitine 3-dehydrogenase